MKIAFTTVLDDKYISGFLIAFNSLLRVSPTFNHDLVVFEWGELSDDNKALIRSLYENVTFKMVEGDLYKDHEYDETFRVWTYNCNYRFDCFTLEEYDRVVFFDCDMIFQLDAEELLSYDVDFGACQVDVGRISQIGNQKGFDAGLMTIGKKYLNKETRNELLNIASSEPPKEEFLTSSKWMSDEPIINTYFLDKITFLPEKFNYLVAELKNKDLRNKNNYQFAGHNKPWYGTETPQQFSEYTLENLADMNGMYLRSIMIKKILKIVNAEIQELKNKNIDVYKYIGKFYE